MNRFEKWRYDNGWWDDNVDVLSTQQLLGNQSQKENRAENLKVMGFSKDSATFVALRKLGYAPEVSGGGVVVTQISDTAPAAKVLKRGDVIIAVDGEATNVDVDLRALITTHTSGDVVTVTLTDNDGSNQRTAQIELTKRDDGTTIIGIATGVPSSISFKFPVDINIDSGNVGGPSAGLAWARSSCRLWPRC